MERALEQKQLRDERRRMQQQLALQATALETAANAILITDRAGTILWVNPAFTTLTGYAAAEVVGKTPRVLKSGKQDQQFYHDFWRTITSGKTWRGEFINRRKDGTVCYDEHTVTPVCSQVGKITHFIGILNDVTERKRAQEALQLLANIVESSDDAIIGASLDGNVTAWNPGAERIYGFSAAEIMGQPLAVTVPPDRVGEERANIDRIRGGEGMFYLQTRRLRKDGQRIDVSGTLSPIKDAQGKIVGVSLIARNTTIQKRQEAELEETQKQLRETAVRIGRAEVARTVVHNIGNVLNGIGVSTALVAQKIQNSKGSNIGKLASLLHQHAADLPAFLSTDPRGKKVPAYVAELAEKFAEEQTQLNAELRLVSEKVEHVRAIIEAHQAHSNVSGLTEAVPASDLVESALRINAASLESRGVRVIREFSPAPPITTEKHKVLQILVNLITNASQALEQGKQTGRQLTFRIDSVKDQSVRISVADNGMGIAPGDLPRIFGQGFTTRQGGHGLGLHGSALLARELGGNLVVTSGGPGQGAVFTLELPFRNTARPEGHSDEVAGVGSTEAG